MASHFQRIRVVVVDGDKRVRDELEAIISGSAEHECVAACATCQEALERVPQTSPDVLLIDIELAGRFSIDCVQALKRCLPGMQIAMLTLVEDHFRIYDSLAAGASGYVLKDSSPTALRKSISDLHEFRTTMSAGIAREVIEDFRSAQSLDTPTTSLSRFEGTILDLVAAGHSYRDLDGRLGMKKGDIQIHLHIIYAKLQFRMNKTRGMPRPGTDSFV